MKARRWLRSNRNTKIGRIGCSQVFVNLNITNYMSMSKLHTETVPASTTQDTKQRKTGNWKIDCERRREESKTLLNFPSPKSLNYYWLLLFYFNIVHLLWTNNI